MPTLRRRVTKADGASLLPQTGDGCRTSRHRARRVVGRWGMSDAIGLVAVLPLAGQGPLLPGSAETSQATRQLLDDEVRRLIDAAQRDVTDLLREHRDQLDALTAALLEAETLDGIDAYRATAQAPSARSFGLRCVHRRRLCRRTRIVSLTVSSQRPASPGAACS